MPSPPCASPSRTPPPPHHAAESTVKMDISTYHQLGRDCYKRGDFTKALEHFTRAITRGESVQLYDHRSACHAKLNDLPAALKEAKKAIQLCREDPTGYLRAGKILLAMEKKSTALEIYAIGLRSIKRVGNRYEALKKAHDEIQAQVAPIKSVDPFTVLPRELALQVLEYLTFRERIAITRTCQQWKSFVRSEPRLWQHLDLSEARKMVRTKFISTAINTAKTNLRAVTLTERIYDREKVIRAVARLPSLREIDITWPDLVTAEERFALKSAKGLTHLTFRQSCTFTEHLARLLAPLKEQLVHLHLDDLDFRARDIPLREIGNLQYLHLQSDGIHDIVNQLSRSYVMHERKSLRHLSIKNDRVIGPLELELDRCENLRTLNLQTHISTIEGIDHRNTPTSPEQHRLPRALHTLNIASPYLPEDELDPSKRLIPEFEDRSPYRFDLPLLTRISFGERILSIWRVLYAVTGKPALHNEATPSEMSFITTKRIELTLRPRADHTTPPALEHVESLMLSEVVLGRRDLIHLTNLIRLMPNVKQLHFAKCHEINGITIKDAVQSLPFLKKIILVECPNVGADAIDWARAKGIKVDVKHNNPDQRTAGRKVRY